MSQISVTTFVFGPHAIADRWGHHRRQSPQSYEKRKECGYIKRCHLATFQNNLVSCASPNLLPAYDQIMSSKAEYMNTIFSGFQQQQVKRRHERKTLIRWIHTPKHGPSTTRRSRECRKQLSKRLAIWRMMEMGESSCLSPNIEKYGDEPLKSVLVLPWRTRRSPSTYHKKSMRT